MNSQSILQLEPAKHFNLLACKVHIRTRVMMDVIRIHIVSIVFRSNIGVLC